MFGMGQYPDRESRLRAVVEMMREVSLQNDPIELVNVYGRRMAEFVKSAGFISISRRGLKFPEVRVTRAHNWKQIIDPWADKQKLPWIRSGLIPELIYSNEPHFIEPVQLTSDDPIHEYLPNTYSLVFIPHYDQGESLNGVVHFYNQPGGFNPEDLPEFVWMSNLFGRAVNNLALSREVRKAYDELDREMRVVEELQQSLLPQSMPEIPGFKLAAHYQTSRRAGGDYYDFFDLGAGLWGIFVADVSGHGTPAAVVMAVTHALAHNYPGRPNPPALMMHYLNQKLCESPTSRSGNFVTAFYGIYDAGTRRLSYCSAGHPEGRLLRGTDVLTMHEAKSLPLGISDEERFTQATVTLEPGDRLALYTDGITESFNSAGEMFGPKRLDDALALGDGDPQMMINTVLEAVGTFSGQARGEDDRTIITALVT